MENSQELRAEWQRLTADLLMEEPPLSLEGWRRQMAVEAVLARILLHLTDAAGDRELERVILNVPAPFTDRLAYANVFYRIAFQIRDLRASR